MADEVKPRFSVTIRDEQKNVTLAVEYDSDIQFRRSLVSLASVIGTYGLERVVELGKQFIDKTSFAEKTS